ncbi:MAG: hypothetical protein IJ593_06250 [Lachnospiraceae bacterium]|nr:hypothetical protein [Lachnospiraceae bacterium]
MKSMSALEFELRNGIDKTAVGILSAANDKPLFSSETSFGSAGCLTNKSAMKGLEAAVHKQKEKLWL